MNLIAAIDTAYGIGCDGNLLYRIPEDLKMFKELTTGKVVVMGHNTLKSLPGSRPLPNRINIVLSKNEQLQIENTVVCHSFDQLSQELKKYNTDDVFLMGGQAIYNSLQIYCKKAYLTIIDAVSQADKFLFKIDDCENWKRVRESEEKTYNELKYKFTEYQNLSPKTL